MQKSDTITALAAALSAAQGEIEGAKKDSTNPHFKSKYADLGAVWDACRGPLTKHGLAVVQFPRSENGCVLVETVLTHKSGEWMSETLALPVSRQDAQGYGSAMTYARRYSLMSVAGIAPEDDDGNAAVAGKTPAGTGATEPGRKSSAQAKRDGDNERIREMFNTAPSLTDLESRWQHVRDNDLPTLPQSWADPIRDAYEAARENLQTLERSAA
ncbi:ERF family protein [uncultured Maricaulis sp.]|uniref:ERF family protein n=1 Tax=uncultured Maricaulis sp. TaxID=174710 RepID=UPI0030DC8420